jgi:hypothetical protein
MPPFADTPECDADEKLPGVCINAARSRHKFFDGDLFGVLRPTFPARYAPADCDWAGSTTSAISPISSDTAAA